jgi:hypothetical protein
VRKSRAGKPESGHEEIERTCTRTTTCDRVSGEGAESSRSMCMTSFGFAEENWWNTTFVCRWSTKTLEPMDPPESDLSELDDSGSCSALSPSSLVARAFLTMCHFFFLLCIACSSGERCTSASFLASNSFLKTLGLSCSTAAVPLPPPFEACFPLRNKAIDRRPPGDDVSAASAGSDAVDRHILYDCFYKKVSGCLVCAVGRVAL